MNSRHDPLTVWVGVAVLLVALAILAGCRTGGAAVNMSRCTACTVLVYSASDDVQQGKTVSPTTTATLPVK